MTITLVIQIITSSFPRVASRKKYMKLDVKGAFLSYFLILLLLFFFFFSILCFDNVVLCRPETEALFYLFKDLFFLCFY